MSVCLVYRRACLPNMANETRDGELQAFLFFGKLLSERNPIEKGTKI